MIGHHQNKCVCLYEERQTRHTHTHTHSSREKFFAQIKKQRSVLTCEDQFYTWVIIEEQKQCHLLTRVVCLRRGGGSDHDAVGAYNNRSLIVIVVKVWINGDTDLKSHHPALLKSRNLRSFLQTDPDPAQGKLELLANSLNDLVMNMWVRTATNSLLQMSFNSHRAEHEQWNRSTHCSSSHLMD